MKMRWAIAASAALALALLTLYVPRPWTGATKKSAPAGVAACDANGKAANLNFTLKDLDNKPVKLAAYKGKVIVLDFWATWCGPCKLEIPGFIRLQNTYGAQGLQTIGISVDDKLDALTPYVAEYKMNYPILQGLDHDDVQDAFGPILGIPTTIVIGRDGTICRKHEGLTGRDTFEREITALLAQKL
jgi:thiol-disulfide isomerase/thioredoxin